MIALLFPCIGLISGVALRFFFTQSAWLSGYIFTLVFGLLVFGWLRSSRGVLLLALGLLSLLIGMVRVGDPTLTVPATLARDLHHHVTYVGVVRDQPQFKDVRALVSIRVDKGEESAAILASVPREPRLVPGDGVEISGTLLVPEPFRDERGTWFAYDQYLARDGISLVIPFASLTRLREAPWYHPMALLARIKNTFTGGINAALSEPHASLASGIIIGGKFGLGSTIHDDFVRSGLVQIIVLSGYNIMIIAEWVIALLSCTPLSRRAAALVAAGVLIIFIGIAGASATALRALIMALIALYARATGKTYAAGRALIATVILLILYNPRLAIYDPGFGLSVTATAGLLWLTPRYELILARMKQSALKELVCTTLAAQTGVLPLLIYTTGLASISSLPATLLTAPFMPLAMAAAFIAGLAGILFGSFVPLLGLIIGYPAHLATSYLLEIAHLFANLPGAVYMLPPISFGFVLLAYALLAYAATSKRFSTMLQLRFAKNASR